MRSLYGEPTLAELGDKLTAQLRELSARPTLDGCDLMVRELAEASTAVARLRMKLERAEAA
jgi:hypothetical protein